MLMLQLIATGVQLYSCGPVDFSICRLHSFDNVGVVADLHKRFAVDFLMYPQLVSQ